MKKIIAIENMTVKIQKDMIPEHLRDRKDWGLVAVFLSGTGKEQRGKQEKLNKFILQEDFK